MAYSRHYTSRLTAEQLLDSIAQATGVEDEIHVALSRHGAPRSAPSRRSSLLPRFFGLRPPHSRQLVCERKQPPTLNQALHLISGDTIQKRSPTSAAP